MKPVELVERAIINSSDVGQVVYDGFIGSGTTIIACEQLGRRGFGIEIDPHYTDVAVARWAAYAGREAMLEGEGATFAEVATRRAAAYNP